MRRRQYLAGLALGGGAALAGCGGLLGETVTLDDPDVSVDEGRRIKTLRYRRDGEQIALLGLEQEAGRSSPTDRFPFRISVPHSDETTVESFRFDLRTPYDATEVPAEMYLKAPGGTLWPPVTFREIENGWTRIAVDDSEGLGAGTLTLETVVDPYAPADRIDVRGEVTLSTSESNVRYRLEPKTSLDLVTA